MNPPLPHKLFLDAHPKFHVDLGSLVNAKLILRALRLIELIQAGEIRGTRLENHEDTGDLSDCHKIYFDLNANRAPRYRIVYRLMPNASKPTVLQILAVGKRNNNEVYKSAVERLKDFT